MSISDAGESELGVVGGETPRPPQNRAARAARTVRAKQDETFDERFRQENPRGDETPTGQQCHPSAIRQEETHKALTHRADTQRQEEAAHCGDPKIQTQRPIGARFTSSLFFRLSSKLGLDNPEKKLDPSLHSSSETLRADTENNSCQDDGQTSPPDAYVNVASDCERIPSKRKEEVICAIRNEPCELQSRPGTRSVELEEDQKDHTSFDKQTDLVELSKPTRTMLSSTVVTVLAPHWTGRLRRTKRFEGTGNSEAMGNFQDVSNTAAYHTQEHFQETVDRSLTDGFQARSRVPFLGTRRNTVGYSSRSGPASLDCDSKRKMTQTVSLDVNSVRMDNRKRDVGTLSPLASPLSPLSLGPNEQRKNLKTDPQNGLSSLSSKPTTSSLLLSLRKCNSNGRNPISASSLSEINPSPSDQGGQLLTTHLSQTFYNSNEQERTKPLLSSSSISHRTTETGLILSPSPSNHRERTTCEKRFFSASPTNKDAEDAPFTQQPQTTNRMQSSLSCSKQAFLRGPSERQLNYRDSDKSTNSSISSTRHSSYDCSPLLKTQLVPRTTLTSTSWWKQVTQEGSSPVQLNDKTKIKDWPSTSVVPPCNDRSDLAPLSLNDNKRFSSQIPQNGDRDNATESLCKGSMKTQRETHNLTQRHADDLLDHESGRLLNQHYDPNLTIREPLKPHGFMVSNTSFRGNATELPPTLLKSTKAPMDSSSKNNNSLCASKINRNPTSPYNNDPESFNKPFSIATTSTLNTKAPTSKSASALPSTQSTKIKTISSFDSERVPSQTNIHASSQTPIFTNRVNTKPLGFERCYASGPKPFQPKTVSSLTPTVNTFFKTNHSPPSTISSSTNGSHPAATTVSSPSFLTPPLTPFLASSPTTINSFSLLTPPATPINTTPNNSDSSSPKEGRTFLSSQKRDKEETKKLHSHVEEKRVRRVTWEDSLDLQQVEPISAKTPEQTQVPTNYPSLSSSPRSIKAPYIFSFLRSNSPTTNASSVCSPTPKQSSIQVVKGGKYRSLSSDSADVASRERDRSRQGPSDTIISDKARQDFTTSRHERTLSVESGTVQSHSSTPLSLPPDFSSGYKLRYSSPPYSTLMSSRSTQEEAKTITPRSPLFQKTSQSNYTPSLSRHTDPVKVITLPTSKPPLPPISLNQPKSLPFQNKFASRESSNYGVSETDQVNNNHSKNNIQDCQNGQILLVNNRVHISSQSLQGDKEHESAPTLVTETLVYSIRSKVDLGTAAQKNTRPKPLQYTAKTPVSLETKLGQQSHTVQRKEATGHSDQGSSSSSSTESQSLDESSNKKRKDNALGKSRFFSLESNTEQSQKRSRFALKKSVSTPKSSLSRSDSDRSNKTNNKMDQVLNKLRQTFSTKRSDDDMMFPWKWKRPSQTASLSGLSDASNFSDITVESTETLEEPEQENGEMLKDSEKGTEINRRAHNRYTLTTPSASGNTVAGDKFYIWSDKSNPDTDQNKQNTCEEHMSKKQPHLTIPLTMHQSDLYNDNDYNATNQLISSRDPSPGRSSNPSVAYPTPFGKSISSPRSPFSPFSSLSPLSFPSPDVTDDSVFYSPKLQRRRESSLPCEQGEGISLGGSRRTRASTGPPSANPGPDKECSPSSYADLKYGIEPGRSFSVSSVLSSRPSGPGRISKGSRFMSVGDLSESALTCEGTGKDLNSWSVTPEWATEYNYEPSKAFPFFPHDDGKMRSRSLPRSLTRCFANWSSGVADSQPVNTTTSKPARFWSPNMNTCPFAWDTEGPPTPPPTPPLSPVSRRMSKPPGISSPTSPSSPGAPQQGESQSSRAHLPSRGYVSSLSTFDESSDSSSDTTTDDEYYLETGENEEKETEL